MIATRLAAPADIPAAASVHIESCLDIYAPLVSADIHAGLRPALEKLWAGERLAGGDFIVLAEVDGAVAGLATVRARAPAYVDHFHVRPALKGRGIGRALWRRAVAEMLGRGMRAAYLDVAVGNDAALAFYRAMGGEAGEEVVGNLFGAPVPALTIRWPDLAAVEI